MTDRPVVEGVRRRLAQTDGDATAERVAAAIRAEARHVGAETVLALVDEVRSETRGAGPLDRLLAEDGVTDVLVNGHEAVYVDRGHGLERADVTLRDEAAVRRLAQRLAAQAGRRLDDASPWVDGRLAGGIRLHAVLAPIARPGTTISLRVPSRRALTLDDLQATGSLAPEVARVLERLVRARVSFVISGGTGSGKTTLLAALLGRCEPAERIVVVEDATELRPRHPHVVGLEARPPNVEGAGTVTLRDLVRQALRMRPDRLVLGEVRGAEVVDLLAALNTGHDGGCGTIHANSARDVPTRFEALGVAAGLPRAAVHSQLASAVSVVVHLRGGQSGRRVDHLAVLVAGEGGVARCVPALTCGDGSVRPGPAHERLAALLR